MVALYIYIKDVAYKRLHVVVTLFIFFRYEFLRSLSYPLPSFRTMTDRIKLTMSQQGQHLNNGPTLSHMRTNRKNLCAFAMKNLAISTNVHEVTLDI